MGKLLVLIDPQNDFTNSQGNYATRHGIKQITGAKPVINRLLHHFRQAAIMVRASYQPNQFGAGLSIAVPGTFGYQLDADITSAEGLVPVLTKTEHSCFSSDKFLTYLKNGQIDTIFLMGFLAEYCVRQTAVDALALGYRVVLVKDCIGTGDDVQQRRVRMFEELENKGAILLDSEDCLQLYTRPIYKPEQLN